MPIVALIVTVVGLVGLALISWAIVQVHSQQQRMSARIDELTGRLWARPAIVSDQPQEQTEAEPVDLFNAFAGKRAPNLALDVLSGGRATLASLLAPAKPLLVVFTDPRCGPCYELLPDLGGWQRVYGDRLSIALVSTGEPKTNIAMTSEYGIRPVLLQQEHELVDAFDLQQAPAAVVIQPNGIVSAGPRYGAHVVRKLVAETLGLGMPEAPSQEAQVAGIGQAAPRLRRPDLNGQAIEIGGASSTPTLLMFWSPGCSGCQKVLPDIKAFESAVERLRVVIVSRGPVGLNQEVGFRSPVVLDDDHSLAQTFGVPGTPAAVLIDGRGMVVTQVARGSDGVRGALQALATSFALAMATA
jgi:thiol-disulfide isomerase/thioredoxin